MMINFEKDRLRISVHVDPGHPTAWQREPYYGRFKQWSREFEGQRFLVVYIKQRAIVVLPDKDVDLGWKELNEDIQIFSEMTPQGRKWGAVKVPAKQLLKMARARPGRSGSLDGNS
jgi:hypothetical protein